MLKITIHNVEANIALFVTVWDLNAATGTLPQKKQIAATRSWQPCVSTDAKGNAAINWLAQADGHADNNGTCNIDAATLKPCNVSAGPPG
jgi:hypothetical protein